MQKKRRTVYLADRETDPSSLGKHDFVFINKTTGEICKCRSILPLMSHIADAVDAGHEWNLSSLHKEQKAMKEVH
jgi:hypothetical protein